MCHQNYKPTAFDRGIARIVLWCMHRRCTRVWREFLNGGGKPELAEFLRLRHDMRAFADVFDLPVPSVVNTK